MNIYIKVLFFVASVFFISCEKDYGQVGINLMPDDEFIEVKVDSTTNFSFKILKDDSINNSMKPMVGSYIDPIFGTTTSEFIAPFYIQLARFNKETAKKLINDPATSVTISFVVADSYYGKLTDKINVKLFMLDPSNTFDSTLYAKPSEANMLINKTENKLLLESNFSYTLTDDKRYIKDDTISFILTGDMKKTLLERIFNESIYSNETNLNDVNRQMRKESFPGLHFKFDEVNQNDGMIVHLFNSTIDISYEDTTLTLGTKDEEINIFTHDFENSQITIGDTSSNNLYIQPMQGVKAKINLLGVEKWADSTNILFNRAFLKVPIDIKKSDTLYYPLPRQIQLSITGPGLNGEKYYNKFTSVDIKDSKNAKLITDDNGNISYLFAIRDFLVYYHYLKLQGDSYKEISISDYNVELYSLSNNSQPHRAVLGSEDATEKINLEIIYTKY
jgi:hypothetical protein